MADQDSWEGQLAFVSSYIIVAGVALLKLWPIAAALQTGQNINFWTLNLPSQGVKTALWVFWVLTSALGGALSALTLAVIHILCRGLWLAFFAQAGSDAVKGVGSLLDGLRRFTYDTAFCLLIYLPLVGFLGIASMIRAGFEHLLITHHSFSVRGAGWMGYGLILIIIGTPVFLVLVRSLRFVSEGGASRIPQEFFSWVLPFCMAGLLLTVMWFLTIQTCYAAGMNVAGQVFHRSRSDLIEVHVTLGGAASDLRLLRLRPDQTKDRPAGNLSVEELGEGQYLATIRADDLPLGRYHVELDYPHSAFDLTFPFLHRHIVVERWFLVVS